MSVSAPAPVSISGASGRRWDVDETPAFTGGQALVHFATADDGARAALKVAIEPGSAGAWLDDERRLLEQLSALPSLRDRVVPVLDAGLWGSRRWFAMPRYDDTLERFVARAPLGERLLAARAVAEAVAALHAAGDGDVRFVHRDIKPTNVMRRGDGAWLLADFGAAREVGGTRTATSTAFHSRGFAPPEQSLPIPQSPSAAWDVFAVAATAYFCAVGRPAVAPASNGLCLTTLGRRAIAGQDVGGAGPAQLLEYRRMRALEEADRRDLRAAVGPALAGTIEGMLAPEPGRRRGTIADLIRAIDAEIAHPRPGTRRVGVVAPLVGAVAVLAIPVAFLATDMSPSAEPKPPSSGCPKGTTSAGDGACVSSTGTRYRVVPAGRMGVDGPTPRIVVVDRPLLVAETEITQGEWEAVLGENPVATGRAQDIGGIHGACIDAVDTDPGLPVSCVGAKDVARYANALSAREGLTAAYTVDGDEIALVDGADGYRLPTADEWRYFATAGGTEGPPVPCRSGNGADRSLVALGGPWYLGDGTADCDDGWARAAQVAKFAPSAWHVYDAWGNVSEMAHGPDGLVGLGGSWGEPLAGEALGRVSDIVGSTIGARLVRSLPGGGLLATRPIEAGGRTVAFGQTEVTQREWRAVLGDTPVASRGETTFLPPPEPRCAVVAGLTLVGDDLPVVCVDWLDAVRFANALSARDGLPPAYAVDGGDVAWDPSSPGWRLPTREEWVAAAGSRRFPGTDDPSALCRFGNVIGADTPKVSPFDGWRDACEDGFPTLAPVGRFLPSPSQVFDLLGNVAEWLWDPTPEAPDQRGVAGLGWRPIAGTEAFGPDDYATANPMSVDARTRSVAIGVRVVRNAP